MSPSSKIGDVEEVRRHTKQLIEAASSANDPVLIEAPPNSGKSRSVFHLAATTETPVTYLAGRTDLYDQAKEWSNEHDHNSAVAPSPFRDCPTFLGENNGDERKATQLYKKGYSGRKIHFLDSNTVHTPCHTSHSPCEYIRKLEQIESGAEEIDFLIGNHQHAY